MKNLLKIEDRWPLQRRLPDLFDDHAELDERLPRQLTIEIFERQVRGQTYVFQRCNSVNIGDRLTDNAMTADDYRFHDVFHYAYVAVLGWSPVTRALLRLKRKSQPAIDEAQGRRARATLIEEGIATWIFGRGCSTQPFRDDERRGPSLRPFEAGTAVCCRLRSRAVSALAVGGVPSCKAIPPFVFLRQHRRGRVCVDMCSRQLSVEGTALKTPRTFASALAATRLASVFNPYSDCCPIHDRPDRCPAPARATLLRCLEAALDSRIDTIWIARDLGYRGGRRTGVPLTDEIHLRSAGDLFGGNRTDPRNAGPRSSHERTAAVVWRVLARINSPVFLWNVFPLHTPMKQGDPFSNRCHSRAEREATWPFLSALVAMIAPRRIVAIGRDAGLALAGIDIPVTTVRHPSYGGQSEFTAGHPGYLRLR